MRGAVGALGGALVLLLVIVVAFAGGGSLGQLAPVGGCALPGGPGPSEKSGNGPVGVGEQKEATLSADQTTIARIIVAVGKGMSISKRGTAIALGTAMQESTLNPGAVSGRSLGLFQQQGSYYADVDRRNPESTTAAFYTMLLKRVPNYANANADVGTGGVAFADAAQIVQASGAGARWYARWERWALTLANGLYDGVTGTGGASPLACKVGGGSGPITVLVNGLTVELPKESGVSGSVTFTNDRAATAIAAALSYLGTPYAWGGGSPTGPTQGIRDGGVADRFGDYDTVGFDCAGLTQYAYAQADIPLTRPARTQMSNAKKVVNVGQAEPGALLFWGYHIHHVAIYLGVIGGTHYMVEAPRSGDVVKVAKVRFDPLSGFRTEVVHPW